MSLPAPRSSSGPARWDRFSEFDDIYRRMGQLLSSVFPQGNDLTGGWSALADISETESDYIVEVDLPGIKQDDVQVEVLGNELAITGDVTERERVGWFRHRTRRTGHFEYHATLPRDVDADNVEASMAEGVLMVRIPKAESAKPRRIPITSG